VLRALALIALVLVIGAAATARFFIWPLTDRPGRADAVVVLSGDHGERMAEARRLLAEGVAPTLVHAGEPDSPEVVRLCTNQQDFEVVCLHPAPDNTRAEARAVGRLVETRAWRSAVVVTSSQHVTRAGILFRRCLEAEVRVVEARPSLSFSGWWHSVWHEWIRVVYVLVVSRSC
jgi:uncharacterized SAM-binding protein YcdF (DUF218 family)